MTQPHQPSTTPFYQHLAQELQQTEAAGLFKHERIITSRQGAVVRTVDGREAINLCANNYLGLAAHPEVMAGAQAALESHGFGLSSVRFICGTQDIHKRLETRISEFLGAEDTILYIAAFDANGGLFEPLFGPEDAIISDELNHASIIDGIRLCKAQRYRYRHNDMEDLERCLREARSAGARHVIVFTDGVFSMDGTIAQLDAICDLAERYGALTGIDECHASGFLGKTGRGTHEYRAVQNRVDIITGTLGKALGGACGGFTSGRREVIELLRQRSRPYLFSNTLPPAVAGGALAALDVLTRSTELRDKLEDNTRYFRQALAAEGFDLTPGEHPIVPIMLYDASRAQQMAARLLDLGVYVVGFAYPVVPRDKARIRVQLSAAHDRAHLETAIAAFAQAGRDTGALA